MPPKPGKPRRIRRLQAIAGGVGTLISLSLVALVFVRVGFPGHLTLASLFLEQLPKQWRWLLPFALLSASMLPSRALQWQAALEKKVPLRERYHLVAIGAFVHNALPGKLGDVTRGFLLSRTRALPLSESLAAVAACKLFEMVWLVLLGLAAFFGPAAVLARFREPMVIAAGLCLGLLLLAFALARFAPRLAGRVGGQKLSAILEGLGKGFAAVKRPRALVRLLALSVLPVAASAVGYGFGLKSMGIAGGLWAGPIILGAIALGQCLLFVPAGTGLYYVATTFAAIQLGASPEQAAVFTALSHLATLAVQVGLGAISLWRSGLKLEQLRAPAAVVSSEPAPALARAS